jgi:hypothetical protein
MKKVLPFILLIALAACNSKPGTTTGSDSLAAKNDSLKNEPFYPIAEYIQSQIAYLDSTPLAIEKHTYVNNKRIDSTTIDRNAFRQLAEEFLKPDLNDPKIKPFYTENSYQDLTINSVTFNYITTDPNQELRQADVLLNPVNNKVKNIIFRKTRMVGDTSVSINGLWKHNMNFQLNYTLNPANGNAQTKQIKVIWDKPVADD